MMAPALSEACSIIRPKSDIGSREPLAQKSLQLVAHPARGLDKLPNSPPVAASPPPAAPSPPTPASSGVGDVKLHHFEKGVRHISKHDQFVVSTLDPCFDTPAPADTPPLHCLSPHPLSPPLSPNGVEDDDEEEEEDDYEDEEDQTLESAEEKKQRKRRRDRGDQAAVRLLERRNSCNGGGYDPREIQLHHAAAVDFGCGRGLDDADVGASLLTCDNMDHGNVDLMNIDCQLPDSPSSQLSIAGHSASTLPNLPQGALMGLGLVPDALTSVGNVPSSVPESSETLGLLEDLTCDNDTSVVVDDEEEFPPVEEADAVMDFVFPDTDRTMVLEPIQQEDAMEDPDSDPGVRRSLEIGDSLAKKFSTRDRLYLKQSLLVDRLKRIQEKMLFGDALRVVERVSVEAPPPSTAPPPRKTCERVVNQAKHLLENPSSDRVAVMKRLESHYDPPRAVKKYASRLQSVTLFKEKAVPRRKGEKRTAVASLTEADGEEKVVLEDDDSLRLVWEHVSQASSSLRCLKRPRVGAGVEEEDELDELTDSSSGGESCDELEFKPKFRAPGSREERQTKLPPIENRAMSRWLAETQTLAARWEWLQINSDNLLSAAHSLENLRRSLRSKKGPVLETVHPDPSVSWPSSTTCFAAVPSQCGKASSLYSPCYDTGYPPASPAAAASQQQQHQPSSFIRKNGYSNSVFTSSTTTQPISTSSPSSASSPPSLPPQPGEEDGCTGTASRCLPLAAGFLKRRLLRVAEGRRKRVCGGGRGADGSADVPEGLLDFDRPVLAASKINSAIHPVLSSMKDVSLNAHLDSLLLILNRAEVAASTSSSGPPPQLSADALGDDNNNRRTAKNVKSEDGASSSLKPSSSERRRSNETRSRQGSPKSSASDYHNHRDRDRDKRSERDRRRSKWEKGGRDGKRRADSTTSSPSRTGSSSRGQKRSRHDRSPTSSTERKRYRDRDDDASASARRRHRYSHSQPGSSREPSPAPSVRSRGGGDRDRDRDRDRDHHRDKERSSRRRTDAASFDINSIVIPYTMCTSKPTKVEYKEIPTPGWRLVDPSKRPTSQLRTMSQASASSSSSCGKKMVMLDERFAVLHISSEEEERKRLMGTTGAVGPGRGKRQRKNTHNPPSGISTPARAASPAASVDQGSEPGGGAYSPALSSPPPTPQSLDIADGKDLFSHRSHRTSNSSSNNNHHHATNNGKRAAGNRSSSESSTYYERRSFPLSHSDLAAVLELEEEDDGKKTSSYLRTRPGLKFDDTGPNLSESSDDSDDEMSDEELSDESASTKKKLTGSRGTNHASATPRNR